MALFNEIQVGRYNAVLHKLLSMEEGAPAPQLSGDLVPTLTIEHDRPEWKFLGGERMCYSSALLGAVADKYNQTVLFNPVGSGVLGIVERLNGGLESNNNLTLYDHTIMVTGASLTKMASVARDYRWTSVTSTLGFYYQVESALVGTRRQVARNAAFDMWEITDPIILPPGYGVGIATHVINLPIACNAWWRERPLEPSETR